jgi:hypothetical protein
MMLLVVGAVMLAAGLFGGGTKIFSVEVPAGFGGRFARMTAVMFGIVLLTAGLYVAIKHPRASAANQSNPMPTGSSKALCEEIKAQWQTKHAWSTNDDAALRQSFQSHGCAAHGLSLP